MLHTMLMKRFGKDDGFTLIELLVVIGILGTLLAVAVPNYIHNQKYNRGKQAETAVDNATSVAIQFAQQARRNSGTFELDKAMKHVTLPDGWQVISNPSSNWNTSCNVLLPTTCPQGWSDGNGGGTYITTAPKNKTLYINYSTNNTDASAYRSAISLTGCVTDYFDTQPMCASRLMYLYGQATGNGLQQSGRLSNTPVAVSAQFFCAASPCRGTSSVSSGATLDINQWPRFINTDGQLIGN